MTWPVAELLAAPCTVREHRQPHWLAKPSEADDAGDYTWALVATPQALSVANWEGKLGELAAHEAQELQLKIWSRKLLDAATAGRQQDAGHYLADLPDHKPPARGCGGDVLIAPLAALARTPLLVGRALLLAFAPWWPSPPQSDDKGAPEARPGCCRIDGCLLLRGCGEETENLLEGAVCQALTKVLSQAAGPDVLVSATRRSSFGELESGGDPAHLEEGATEAPADRRVDFEVVVADENDRLPALEVLRLEDTFGGARRLLPLLAEELCAAGSFALRLELPMG